MNKAIPNFFRGVYSREYVIKLIRLISFSVVGRFIRLITRVRRSKKVRELPIAITQSVTKVSTKCHLCDKSIPLLSLSVLYRCGKGSCLQLRNTAMQYTVCFAIAYVSPPNISSLLPFKTIVFFLFIVRNYLGSLTMLS